MHPIQMRNRGINECLTNNIVKMLKVKTLGKLLKAELAAIPLDLLITTLQIEA